MISHLSIVYMRGASRQYGSTLNPPLLSLFPPPFPPSCGKYERGKEKKFGPPPRLAEIVERGGGEQRKGILSCFAPSSSPPTFFRIVDTGTAQPTGGGGEARRQLFKIQIAQPSLSSPSSFLNGNYDMEKGGGEDQKQNPPTIFGSEREGRRTIKLAVKLQKLHPPADGKGGARKC